MEIKKISNIFRLKDIVTVLVKHGFGDIVLRLDLPVKGLVKTISPEVDLNADVHERIRLAVENLGPTFIKMGQIMSMRPDLLPPEMAREFGKLLEEAAPLPFESVKQVIEEAFGKPLDTVFHSFEETPLASASLSQVHRAVHKKKGTDLAVKVRRPGIGKMIRNDLDIMEMVARQCHENIRALRIYDLPGIVKTCREMLIREIDFRKEARYIQIGKSTIERDRDIYIPDVFMEYSTSTILVTRFVKGTKIDHTLDMPFEKRKKLGKAGIRSGIRQVLDHGFFHADPHPGNVVIVENNRLCLMDWGMVGRLTDSEKQDLLHLILAITENDSRKLAEILVKISVGEQDVDLAALERHLLEILDSYLSVPLKNLRISDLLTDVVSVLKEHYLRLSPVFSIVIKALITVEGTARTLYPELDAVSEATPHIRRLMSKQYAPGNILHQIKRYLTGVWHFQRHLPSRLGAILQKMEEGRITIRFKHENLDGFQKTIENMFNRLTLGIIISAMIIGSSMIITTGVKPLLMGFPALGIIGYLIAAVLGLWLVFTIIRGRDY